MKPLATIGYEGASPDGFDEALAQAKIELLVDVRAVAVSRKRGFSKTALAERLESKGVRYVHLRGLGDPKSGREAARAGNFALFRTIFASHLDTAEARADLERLRSLVAANRVALLCYEADAAGCHRAIVASSIAKVENLPIVHLRVEGGQALDGGRTGTDHHPREGLAAA